MSVLSAVFSLPSWLIGSLALLLIGAVLVARWGIRLWREDQQITAADPKLTEWHHEAHERLWGDPVPWWDDPDLTVWDAKQAAARCWEIVHVEFPRLRAELGLPRAVAA